MILILKNKGLDESTGLLKRIRVKDFKVSFDKSVITVNCVEELVSPTGVIVQELSEYPHYIENLPETTDAEGNTTPGTTDFDTIVTDPVGVSIVSILEMLQNLVDRM